MRCGVKLLFSFGIFCATARRAMRVLVIAVGQSSRAGAFIEGKSKLHKKFAKQGISV
jgi:hypothetical protein